MALSAVAQTMAGADGLSAPWFLTLLGVTAMSAGLVGWLTGANQCVHSKKIWLTKSGQLLVRYWSRVSNRLQSGCDANRPALTSTYARLPLRPTIGTVCDTWCVEHSQTESPVRSEPDVIIRTSNRAFSSESRSNWSTALGAAGPAPAVRSPARAFTLFEVGNLAHLAGHRRARPTHGLEMVRAVSILQVTNNSAQLIERNNKNISVPG
jgi:hypothetical protein